jgi:hypothetical protein
MASPGMTSAPAPSGTPGPVLIVVEASVRESCGSIGGCAYFASISGPAGNWTAELEGTASSLGSTALPPALAPGQYAFAFRSAFVSDEVLNGQRQIGPTDVECSTTIDVAPGASPRIQAVFNAGSCEITSST